MIAPLPVFDSRSFSDGGSESRSLAIEESSGTESGISEDEKPISNLLIKTAMNESDSDDDKPLASLKKDDKESDDDNEPLGNSNDYKGSSLAASSPRNPFPYNPYHPQHGLQMGMHHPMAMPMQNQMFNPQMMVQNPYQNQMIHNPASHAFAGQQYFGMYPQQYSGPSAMPVYPPRPEYPRPGALSFTDSDDDEPLVKRR